MRKPRAITAVYSGLALVLIAVLVATLVRSRSRTQTPEGATESFAARSIDSGERDGPSNGELRVRSDRDRFRTTSREGLGFEPGQRLTYDFRQTRTVQVVNVIDTGQPDAPPTRHTFEMEVAQRGRLVVQVHSDILDDGEPAGWLLRFQLVDPQVETGFDMVPGEEQLQAMREARAAVEDELSRTLMMARVARCGRIEDVRVSGPQSDDARNHWRDILSRWQVVLSDSSEDLRWEVTEEDSTGTYLAQYEASATNSTRRVTKQKLRYTEIQAQSPGPPGGEMPRSRVVGRTTVDLDPFQTTIAGNETLRLAQGGCFFVSSNSEFRFQLVGLDTDASDSSGSYGTLTVGESDRLMRAAGECLTWRNTADERYRRDPPASTPEQIDELIAQLKAIHSLGAEESQAELGTAMQLIRGVRAGGEPAVDQVLRALTDEGEKHDYAAVLTGVLSGADTPEAQCGLLEVIRGRDWPMPTRRLALESMVQVTKPIEEADKVYRELHGEGGELADAALLMLGVTGDRVREDSDERYEGIAEYVDAAIEDEALTPTAGNEDAVFTMLATVGNLGPAEVPPFVAEAAGSEDAAIRAQAMLSLTRIPTEEADRLIENALLNDEDEEVRVAALRAAADPCREQALTTMRDVAASNACPRLRTEALQELVTWCEDRDAIETVRRVAESDPSEEVRDYAQEWLRIHVSSLEADEAWLEGRTDEP